MSFFSKLQRESQEERRVAYRQRLFYGINYTRQSLENKAIIRRKNCFENMPIVLPEYKFIDFSPKQHDYAVCIPVFNEGERIRRQLEEMQKIHIQDVADIFICDGGSTDNCTHPDLMKKLGVNLLIERISPGHMSDQLMLCYYFAVTREYKYCITIDGNGKDSVDGIFTFIEALKEGYDLIQGSRYLPSGASINTPKYRDLAIRLLHVPVINKLSGFRYTDTTNGFRAHNTKLFEDPRINPFRYGIFPTYALIHYLTVRAPRSGYRITEVPVTRKYPFRGKIPSKVSFLKGNLDLLKILWNLKSNKYDPPGTK
ncbi:MAG: glycosyltransferase family 2 protein [Endomicrobium sp.]|jgi:dolichol-phosphate mannosyltransferase|nr:glycosyltransferase family 2 protein [Endomicrobium sp.]